VSAPKPGSWLKKAPRNECGKSSWPTETLANAALSWIHAHPHTEVLPVRSYRCDKCRQWHLTSKVQKMDRGSCGRKGWISEEFAFEALEQFREHPREDRAEVLDMRLCDCGLWHVVTEIDLRG